MALTKEEVQDKIEVLEDGTMQIRIVTRVFDNDVLVAESYHRKVVTPEDDVTNETGLAKEIADKIFTPTRKADYRVKMNNRGNK